MLTKSTLLEAVEHIQAGRNSRPKVSIHTYTRTLVRNCLTKYRGVGNCRTKYTMRGAVEQNTYTVINCLKNIHRRIGTC